MAFASRPTYTRYHEGPWYEENLRYQLEHEESFLQEENMSAEAKEEIKSRIATIKHELEVGYEQAREENLQRELSEIKGALIDPDTPETTKKFIKTRIEIIEAQLEYGDDSLEVERLYDQQRLEAARLSLGENHTPEEMDKLKSIEREMELRIERTQQDNNQNSFYLLTMFFSTVGSLLLPLIIVLVAAETISGEYSLGTIKLLLIKPFSRVKLYMSKYTALMIYGVFVFVVVSILGYLIGGTLVGFGGANLTRIVGRTFVGNNFNFFTDYTNAFLVSNFQYLIMMLGLFLVLMTALIAFSMLISVFTKSATISLVATMGLVIFGNIMSTLLRNFSGAKYLLTSHINILNHLEGDLVQPDITLTFSIVIILIYTAVCLAAGIYSFKQKDIV